MASVVPLASECPICHSEVAVDATECPTCGEAFEPIEVETPVPEQTAETAETAGTKERTPGFREKFLYYAGIALILLGGPGFALGSWLHDVLRISFLNYTAFDAFGPVNRLVLALGLIVMIVGIVFLILSLRLTRPAETEQAA